MDCYNSEQFVVNMYEELCDERDRNEKLNMRNDALEEEISYLRGMVKYLVKHISTKVNLDESCTVDKIVEDLKYFEEKNYDIKDACIYGKKDHINYEQRMW